MIIVVTHDRTMRDFYGSYVTEQRNGYDFWRRAAVLDQSKGQQAATRQLTQLLGQLRADEPLCLVGHGNDHGIGDATSEAGTWWWDAGALATLFRDGLPDRYQKAGKVLFESCGESVTSVQPRVALALEGSRLKGMWIYGYQDPTDLTAKLPTARQLDNGRQYTGAQVT